MCGKRFEFVLFRMECVRGSECCLVSIDFHHFVPNSSNRMVHLPMRVNSLNVHSGTNFSMLIKNVPLAVLILKY